MAKISINKRSKERLKKVMHVLFPEYKYIKITKNLGVVASKYKYWIARIFHKKDNFGYNILIKHYLPTRLAQLKYNNDDFLSVIIEDVTSVQMKKDDVIMYFFKEIVMIKYQDVFKEVLNVQSIINDEVYDECEMTESVHFKIRRESERVNRVVRQTFITRLQCHPMYYEYITLGIVIAVLISYLIFNHK
jgi:hypothetical protein